MYISRKEFIFGKIFGICKNAVFSIQLNDVVAVQYKKNIYRGKLISENREYYTFFLIDIGEEFKISSKEAKTYSLPCDLANVKGAAVKCQLKEPDINVMKYILQNKFSQQTLQLFNLDG